MERLKIDVRANDGSPLGVSMKSLFGEDGRSGVGGAEQYLLSLCEFWTKQGHDVTLYNDPKPGWESPFEQRPVASFDPAGQRDILIMFRSPNPIYQNANGKRIFLSCDQQTCGNFNDFKSYSHKIVTISPFHSRYFSERYGFDDTIPTDIPIRLSDYEDVVKKVPYSCTFNSVPDRGLDYLAVAWPRIVERVPEANLTITSGWSLWTGKDDAQYLHPYRMKFLGMKNVEYLGAVKRNELVQIQKRSAVFSYPCTYDELFCISCAEAQVAGAYPITSSVGALETTNMGTQIKGHPRDVGWIDKFVDEVCGALSDPWLPSLQGHIRSKALERFDIQKVGEQWENIFLS